MREGRPSNLSGKAYSTRSTSLSYVDESGAGLLAVRPSASSSDGAGAASWRHDILCERYCCPSPMGNHGVGSNRGRRGDEKLSPRSVPEQSQLRLHPG